MASSIVKAISYMTQLRYLDLDAEELGTRQKNKMIEFLQNSPRKWSSVKGLRFIGPGVISKLIVRDMLIEPDAFHFDAGPSYSIFESAAKQCPKRLHLTLDWGDPQADTTQLVSERFSQLEWLTISSSNLFYEANAVQQGPQQGFPPNFVSISKALGFLRF